MVTRQSPASLAVLVIGTDTVIEALPARPIQLAHACGQLGYDLVIPASWGDELVAHAAVDAIGDGNAAPAVLCACPVVRQRLLQHGSQLARSMVSLVAPPIAVARYLRSHFGERLRTLEFAGRCPDARKGDYDEAFEPDQLLSLVRSRGIELRTQPDSYLNQVPPDRRRFVSLPGGCPTADALWRNCNERTLVEIEERDLSVALAQNLLTPRPVLVDVAPAMGCSCSGVTHTTSGASARVAAMSIEPPRSAVPILDVPEDIDLSGEGRQIALHGSPGSPATRRIPLAVTPLHALRTPS